MERISWIVHPLKTEHRKTALVFIIILAFCSAVYLFSHEFWWTFFSALVLFISVKDHFLPVRYTLDSDGVEKAVFGFARKRSWTQVKRVVKLEGGVLLSLYPKPHRFEAIMGFYLRFGSDDPAPILNFIEEKISVG